MIFREPKGLHFATLMIAALLFLFSLSIFSPGLMTFDSFRQYEQAVTGQYSNTHPPILAFIWRGMLWIYPGPFSMLVLNLALYWSAFACLAIFAINSHRKGRGLLVLAGGLFPFLFGFSGVIWKDVTLATSWGLCSAILLLLASNQIALSNRIIAFAIALIALLLGAATRHNAFPAAIILGAALSAQFPDKSMAVKAAAFGLIAVACVMSVPVWNHLLQARDRAPFANLVDWDLTGISYFSGTNYRSPPPASLKAGELNCYSPRLFDSCKVTGFRDTAEAFDRWKTAILKEPMAYLKHRGLIVSMLLRFGCRECKPLVWVSHNDANPYGMTFEGNQAFSALGRLTTRLGDTLIGRPYIWLVTALGLIAMIYRDQTNVVRWPLISIGLSGITYAATLTIATLSDDFRYLYWLLFSVIIMGSVCLFGSRRSATIRSVSLYIVLPLILAATIEIYVRITFPTDFIAPSMTTSH